MERPVDTDLERLRAALEQRLGRQHMLDLGGSDAEGERPERPVGRGMRVAAHDRHARLCQAQLRADDMDDPLVRRADAVERDAELAAVVLQALHLGRGDLIGDREAAVGGRDRMVGGGDGLPRAPHTEAALAQAVEGLRARHLVDEVQVDAEDVGGSIGALGNDVLVPDLLDDRSRAC